MKRSLLLAALCAQVALLAWVSWPRLSPRLSGAQYSVFVRAYDPIDPFRGHYAELNYGDQPNEYGLHGTVWVPLRQGHKLWAAEPPVRRRPSGTPAMRCDADGYQVRCGIESFFASAARASSLEDSLHGRGAIAQIKIDGDGRAAIVGLQPR